MWFYCSALGPRGHRAPRSSPVTAGNILMMEEIMHQLMGSLSVYPIILRRVFYIPGGAGFLPPTVLNTTYIL